MIRVSVFPLLSQRNGSFSQAFKNHIIEISSLDEIQSRLNPVPGIACSCADSYLLPVRICECQGYSPLSASLLSASSSIF